MQQVSWLRVSFVIDSTDNITVSMAVDILDIHLVWVHWSKNCHRGPTCMNVRACNQKISPINTFKRCGQHGEHTKKFNQCIVAVGLQRGLWSCFVDLNSIDLKLPTFTLQDNWEDSEEEKERSKSEGTGNRNMFTCPSVF